jgi:hypothetical protein
MENREKVNQTMRWRPNRSGSPASTLRRVDAVGLKRIRRVAEFLTDCQILESRKPILGTVCPWELNRSLPAREDYHDTLQALWVWETYESLAGDHSFSENQKAGWRYVLRNQDRFLSPTNPEALNPDYDSCYVLLATNCRSRLSSEMKLLAERASRVLAESIKSDPDPGLREYFNPWWHVSNLADYGKKMKDRRCLGLARAYAEKWLPCMNFKPGFKERYHSGPGRHDFFASHGLMIYAACCTDTVSLLPTGLMNMLPDSFVVRKNDENPWNASVCWGLGKLINVTADERLSRSYESIMRVLNERVRKLGGGLARDKVFPERESWATFFWIFANLASALPPSIIESPCAF